MELLHLNIPKDLTYEKSQKTALHRSEGKYILSSMKIRKIPHLN
jgi:hypothetical protein